MYQSNYDQNIYHIIGREWMKGHLPYSELSDIKGPVQFLYFGLGSLITPRAFTGIALFHAFLVAVGFLYSYKTSKLFLSPPLALLSSCVYFSYVDVFAAHPAELAWCMQHIVLYWFLSGTLHYEKNIYLYGLFIGLIIAVKFNLIAFFAPFGVFLLWTHNSSKWHSWNRCLLAVGGCLTVILPLALYFYIHGALLDLVHEYFGACLKYGSCTLSESSLVTENVRLCSSLLPFPCNFLPLSLRGILGIVVLFSWCFLIPKTIKIGAGIVLAGALLCSICGNFLGHYSFSHYFITLYPFCFLSVLAFVKFISNRLNSLSTKGIYAGAIAFVCVVISMNMIWGYYIKTHPRNGVAQHGIRNEAVANYIGNDSFICVNPHGIVFYRVCNRYPGIKHFIPQMIDGGTEAYKNELVQYIRRSTPKYVVASAKDEQETEALIINSNLSYVKIQSSEFGVPDPSPVEITNNATVLWRLQL